MAIVDFITEPVCIVDDEMKRRFHSHHSQAALYSSELITIGLLYAITIKGVGTNAFYRWLSANYSDMFPRLPELTRLFRRLRASRLDRALLGFSKSAGAWWTPVASN